jgi:MerR family copper efflux transcriptional regulator
MASAREALTINEAARTTGWSARMLRYVERMGLLAPRRTRAGYRLYGPAELQRLRTLRELLVRFGLELAEVGFAARLRREPALRSAIDRWLESEPERPREVAPSAWLRFEQDRHERLLAAVRSSREEAAATAAAAPAGPAPENPPTNHRPRRVKEAA